MSGILDKFLRKYPPLYILLQPFGAFPTWVILALYTAWCIFVIHTDLYKKVPDVSGPSSILGTTIAVTLPLLASAAIQRNKESLFNYNAFCGDVLALGWEILSYVRDPKQFTVSEANALKIQQAFEICLILPTVVKWKFRNNAEFDIEEVYMLKNYKPEQEDKKEEPPKREQSFGLSGLMDRQDRKKKRKAITSFSTERASVLRSSSGQERRRVSMVNYRNPDGDSMARKFVLTSIGIEYKNTLLEMGGKLVDGGSQVGIDKCDLLYVFLFDLISEFEASDTRKNMITRTAERVYGSYGNMGNISGYQIPMMYKTYMYIAIGIFMVIFPFTYGTSGGNYDIIGVNESLWDARVRRNDVLHNIEGSEWDMLWHGLIVIYFLFGMHLMTLRVANAFVSTFDAVGFDTVGKSESGANTSLHNMYKKRLNLQKNMKLLPKDFDEIPSSPRGGESKTSLLHRKRLYV